MKGTHIALLLLALGGCTSTDQTGEGIAEEGGAAEESVAESETADTLSLTSLQGDPDIVRLIAPHPDEVIHSPLVVRGLARGPWFFEGSFRLVLTNWDGLILAEGVATAGGEWMTTEYVPFEGTLTFEAPEDIGDFSRRGSLILQKESPSGLPENSDALELTVFFREAR